MSNKIELVLHVVVSYGCTMSDLKKMSDLTKSAFQDGEREM